MEVSSVSAPAPVKVQEKIQKSAEELGKALIDPIKEVDDSARQAKETGNVIDVKA